MATRVLRLLALLASVLLLTGCGGTVTPGTGSGTASEAASKPPSRGPAATVSLTVSGGFAGVGRSIEVRPGGRAVLDDRKDGPASRELSDAEQKRLGSLLDAVDFSALPARSVSASARDLFEYRLAYDGHTLVTDRSRDLGAADDLITHLESLMAAPK
ncbi:hypothetical protein [Streptomyces sp. NPDC050738]|uniref:hypothetical protein n=1 Tax=Streptomyces sp. NPDC050738 TaxID=3154744 RepID=UPI003429E94F